MDVGNALRALVLLACSWSAGLVISNAPSGSLEKAGSVGWLLVAALVVPFVMAVLVAWRGHDR